MERNFTTEPHFMMQAVAKAGIAFPISKEDAIARAGDLTVKTDYDQWATLQSILERMEPSFFPNASVFYCSYMAAQTAVLMKQLY